MKKLQRLKKKLGNQAGETIAETLVAMLIASLALVMLASMIQSTVNLVTRSKTKMEEYYEKNIALEQTALSEKTAPVSIAGDNSAAQSGSVKYSGQASYETNNTFSKLIIAYSYTDQTADGQGDTGG